MHHYFLLVFMQKPKKKKKKRYATLLLCNSHCELDYLIISYFKQTDINIQGVVIKQLQFPYYLEVMLLDKQTILNKSIFD